MSEVVAASDTRSKLHNFYLSEMLHVDSPTDRLSDRIKDCSLRDILRSILLSAVSCS